MCRLMHIAGMLGIVWFMSSIGAAQNSGDDLSDESSNSRIGFSYWSGH